MGLSCISPVGVSLSEPYTHMNVILSVCVSVCSVYGIPI